MKIYRLSRPPVKTIFNRFPQTRDLVLNETDTGHEIQEFVIRPVRMGNFYLSYGFGIVLSVMGFLKIKPDLILADNIESGIAALLIKSIFHIPFLFNFIDDYSLIASYDKWRLRYWGLRFFEKVIPKFADLVVVVDSMKKQYCLDMRIPGSKIRMVPNGANTNMFKPEIADNHLRDRFGLNNGGTVLFVGKINKYYRLETILKAVPLVLAKFPETRFLFVGDGDNLHYLKGLSGQLGIRNSVVFTGFRPPEEIPKIINLSDLCVFPLPDSSALAIFEYMACAKPVVLPTGGTKKMGIPKEMIPEDCAVRVENCPEGFAQGIIFLFENKVIAEEMGKKARELTVRLHDWKCLAKNYKAVLEETLSSTRFS